MCGPAIRDSVARVCSATGVGGEGSAADLAILLPEKETSEIVITGINNRPIDLPSGFIDLLLIFWSLTNRTFFRTPPRQNICRRFVKRVFRFVNPECQQLTFG